MNRSLRSQLIFGIAVATLIGFVASAVATYGVQRASLVREFDSLLASKARSLASLVKQRDGELEIAFDDYPLQEFARQVRPEYYQLWDEQGRILARSRRLERADLAPSRGSLISPQMTSVRLPDERHGRTASLQFRPAEFGERLHSSTSVDDDDEANEKREFARKQITLVVGRGTASIDEALSRLAWILTGVCGVAFAGTVTAATCLIKSRLKPLNALAAEIGRLDAADLDHRLNVPGLPCELDPVASRLNELLDRLASAFERERTMTANVAHELRTPLAGLRSTLDVALSREREAAEYHRTLQNCDTICHDTQRLVEALLSLAQKETGQTHTIQSQWSFAELAAQCWKPFESQAELRRLAIVFHGPACLVQSDREHWRVVLSNLFENAVEYVDEGGMVDIHWEANKELFEFRIANTCRRLERKQAARVFERFWRADGARAIGSHTGLGLALTKEIVERLGGTISATADGAKFTISIAFRPGIPTSHASTIRGSSSLDRPLITKPEVN